MSKTKDYATSVVARINKIDLLLIENGEKRVAIKPICEALGIDYSSQLQKIKEDEILNSVVGLSTTTGSDGKEYEMQTIPLKYVFGWLFTINPKNVSEAARPTVIKYRMECYDALFNHFSLKADYVNYKNKLVEEQLDVVVELKDAFSIAKTRLKEEEIKLKEYRDMDFDKFKDNLAQMEIEFEEHQEETKSDE